MAFTSLSSLTAAIAADAGVNSGTSSQAAFTVIGSIEAGKREGGSRVIWIPGEESIEPADQDESDSTKIAYERRLTCEVRFQGDDFDSVSTLVSHFLAAVFRTQTPRSVRPIKGTHAEQALTGLARWQISYEVEVSIPVVFESLTVSEIEQTSQTGTVTD